jgi:hypothetical protein
MSWSKYYDLEPIRRLRSEGRELLGKSVFLTEKRDGENVSIWLENSEPHVSSHNMKDASGNIVNRFKETPEYKKAVQLLKDEKSYNHNFILYGELLLKVSPTRIEPKRKKIHWIMFDIFDLDQKMYLNYTAVFQKAYHYKIPIVKCVDVFVPSNMEDIDIKINELLKWCKKHRREGIVGKCFENQVFFKEKIDIPKLPKIPKQVQVQYPPMPEEKIIRSLQHAFDEIGEENWKNTKIAMPIVAKHFQIEAKEHNYSTPRNIYRIWLDTPMELIKGETLS